MKGDNDPYYNAEWSDDKGWVPRWKLMDIGSGPDGKSAKMDDGPENPDVRMKKGAMVAKFETFVVCIDTATVLGGITWGYTVKDDPNSLVEITGGTKADVKLKPSGEWWNAVKAWNAAAYKNKGWFTFDI